MLGFKPVSSISVRAIIIPIHSYDYHSIWHHKIQRISAFNRGKIPFLLFYVHSAMYTVNAALNNLNTNIRSGELIEICKIKVKERITQGATHKKQIHSDINSNINKKLSSLPKYRFSLTFPLSDGNETMMMLCEVWFLFFFIKRKVCIHNGKVYTQKIYFFGSAFQFVFSIQSVKQIKHIFRV